MEIWRVLIVASYVQQRTSHYVLKIEIETARGRGFAEILSIIDEWRCVQD